MTRIFDKIPQLKTENRGTQARTQRQICSGKTNLDIQQFSPLKVKLETSPDE
jgi:hypothetical protein